MGGSQEIHEFPERLRKYMNFLASWIYCNINIYIMSYQIELSVSLCVHSKVLVAWPYRLRCAASGEESDVAGLGRVSLGTVASCLQLLTSFSAL